MNRLAESTSPYLLQHADNPVDWWPWCSEAFAEARASGRPVLLSVGYAACHWCHVMAHESFENEAIAGLMNALFVNIKVDREERPDVDQIYMAALHALGEQGGWPLTMFLDGEGAPFWGGTYFPPESRYGRPGFPDILNRVAEVYRDHPETVRQNAGALRGHLSAVPKMASAAPGRPALDELGRRLAAATDPVNGGLAGAPKFPNPALLEFLWRHHARTGEAASGEAFLRALEGMARGGIHDHLAGGFARYSVDEHWLVPHFEKMLYDNAQLLELYAVAASESGEARFAEAARGIVRWLRSEMQIGAAFAASLDADSEGEEGRFYVWTEDAFADEGEEALRLARTYLGLTPQGNWEGVTVLHALAAPPVAPPDAGPLDALKTRLLARRERRPRPGRDDKVLADWNGLMIAALVRAGLALDEPDWLDLAADAYRFITESMRDGDSLGHSWRQGRLLKPGFALDLAAMTRAALALHEARGDDAPLADARRWVAVLEQDYRDAQTGLLAMTSGSGDTLIARPRSTHDDAVPNANGVHAENLVRLAMLTGTADDLAAADAFLQRLLAAAAASPLSHASALNALDLRLSAATISAPPGRDDLIRAALAVPYPNRIVRRDPKAPDGALICIGERCTLPVTDPNRVAETLAALRSS